jgi:hypothetical protein
MAYLYHINPQIREKFIKFRGYQLLYEGVVSRIVLQIYWVGSRDHLLKRWALLVNGSEWRNRPAQATEASLVLKLY